MSGTREITGITLHIFSDGDISGMNSRKNLPPHREGLQKKEYCFAFLSLVKSLVKPVKLQCSTEWRK